MKNQSLSGRAVSTCLVALSFSLAANARAESRVTQPVDESKRVALSGNLSPRLKSGVDEGAVDPSMPLPYVTLVLKPSASQQADLNRLLAEQQNPSSPNYHHWLTPQQYGERFGVGQGDLDKIVSWIGQHGLSVKSVANGRTSIAFGGTASQVESAFSVEIHHYRVGGELHYSNSANPTIPAAFQDVVHSIHGLQDFRMKPKFQRSRIHPVDQPRFTQPDGSEALAPDDFAIIYDITPLYTASITGTGQKIVIVGQTQLPLSDIQTYRSTFNLPVNTPTVTLVPGTKDPGVSKDDLVEADLDVEIAGAIARNASIFFIYSENVEDAFQYAIDQNTAPVLNTSYGECELQDAPSDVLFQQSLVLQANTQGMTVFAPSGDDASVDCAGDGNAPGSFADEDSLAVDTPGSIPQVTAVGGTEFNEGNNTYWTAANTANKASALSYIPEVVWNDSASDGSPSGSGGGASVYFVKPWWQTGTGVPADGVRDVPDVALTASADHDGYYIYSSGSAQVVGGTSASTQAFGAMMALVGQYQLSNGFQTSGALGQINPVLYTLASAPGVFHDITSGTISVPPCDTQPGCALPAIGYSAGVGYDQATGLGTVDVYNLAKAWHAATQVKVQPSETLAVSVPNLAFSDSTVLTASVTGTGATPTGIVNFSVGNSVLGSIAISGSGSTAAASLTVSGMLLGSGSNMILAQYEGDATYTGAAAYGTATVTSAASGTLAVTGVSNAASFTQVYAPGGIISVFGTQLAPETAISSAPLAEMLTGTSVTIQGLAAPLYFASTGQLNVQVPYGIPAGSSATLTVYNGDQVDSTTILISETAPAIFTYNGGPVPYTTAARGQEVFLYITGAGALTPAVNTGATPAASTAVDALPTPVGAVQVTVGGVAASTSFVGVPTWSVGAVQINYTIPAGAPLGAQPVVVSVGGVASAAATLTITQ